MRIARWLVAASLLNVGCVADSEKPVVTFDGGTLCADNPSLPGCTLAKDGSAPILQDATPGVDVVVTTDAAVPSITITSPAPFAVVCPSFEATVDIPANAPPLTYACELDGAPLACSPPKLSFSNLSGGSHTLVVHATGPGGVTGTAQLTFVVDDAKPLVTFTAPASNATTCPAGSVAYALTDPGGTGGALDALECKLERVEDGTVVSSAACGGTLAAPTYSGLTNVPNGTYRVTVRGKDACGNEGEASRNFNVDDTGPTLTVASSLGLVNTGTASFAITPSESLGTVTGQLELAMPSASPAMSAVCTCTTATCSCSQLAAGTNRLSFTATDTCGNAGPATTVDVAPSFGPFDGHAVVIGHDYTDATTPARLVGNAVALAPHVHHALPVSRSTVRVLAFRPTGATQTTATRVKSAITTALGAYNVTFDATDPTQYVEFSDYTQLDTLLRGRDVLLVFDPAGSMINTLLDSIGDAWAGSLESFTNRGGVVVALESSNTYRLLSGGSRPLVMMSGTSNASVANTFGGFQRVTEAYPASLLGTDNFFITKGVTNDYALPSGSVCLGVTDTQASTVYERYQAICGDGCNYSLCPIVVDRAVPAFDVNVAVANDPNADLPACLPPITGSKALVTVGVGSAQGGVTPVGNLKCAYAPQPGYQSQGRPFVACDVASSTTFETATDTGRDGLHHVDVALVSNNEPLRVRRTLYARDTTLFVGVTPASSNACGATFIVNDYAPGTDDAACAAQVGSYVPFKSLSCTLEYDDGESGGFQTVATRTGASCGAAADSRGGFLSGNSFYVDWASDIADGFVSGTMRATVSAQDFHGNTSQTSTTWSLGSASFCGANTF